MSEIVDVSVVIVNWNSRDDLRTCLKSVWAWTHGCPFEVIVVDNASYDGCAEMLQREFPSVLFVQSPRNLGFAGANNLGARRARGLNLLFLNPDTELLEDSVSVLVQRLGTLPGAGAAGCRMLNRDHTLQTSCVQSFPTVLNQVLDSDFLREKFPASSLWGTAAFLSADAGPKQVEVVSGACIALRRSVFDEVGGFTEGYFMYGEDLDLCFKVRRAGYRVLHLPETSVVHYGGSSTEKQHINFSNVMMRESVFRFLRFNRGWASASAYRLAMIVSAVFRLALILPMCLMRSRLLKRGSASIGKWTSILRWGLGIESWVQDSSV